MRAAAVSQVALVGLVVGFAGVNGCSGGNAPVTKSMAGVAGSSTGTAGAAAGTAGIGTAGAAGIAGADGTGAAGMGAAGAGAAGMGTAGAAGTGAAGIAPTDAGAVDSGAAGTTDAGTDAGGAAVDLTKVVPTIGCGMDATGFTPGTLVKFTMVTSGVKDPMCADSKCGAWGPWTREYFVQLPTGYNKTKAYPLIFEGPGCAGHGNNLYALPDLEIGRASCRER